MDAKIKEGLTFAKKTNNVFLIKKYYCLSGHKELFKRDYEKAIPLLKKGDLFRELRSDPAFSGLALCYLKTDRIKEYEKALKKREQYFMSEYLKIKIARINRLFRGGNGDIEQCKKEIKIAKTISPRNQDIAFYDVFIKLMEGKPINAQKWEKQCKIKLSKKPYQTMWRLMLGMIYENTGKTRLALTQYEKLKAVRQESKIKYEGSFFEKRMEGCKSKIEDNKSACKKRVDK